MKDSTKERLEAVVKRIKDFDILCSDEEYTDSGDAWDVLNFALENCEQVLKEDPVEEKSL